MIIDFQTSSSRNDNTTTTIIINAPTKRIKLKIEVRHRNTIYPKLLIINLVHALKTLNWKLKGINVDEEYLNHLSFAKDIVLIASASEEAKKMLVEKGHATPKV